MLIIYYLISKYLNLRNKGSPEKELPNIPGLLQVYICKCSSDSTCRWMVDSLGRQSASLGIHIFINYL